jgi:NAD(P)-dependent dehydrogenase (short-subunit alcohol dehydrogenase family)
MTEKPIAIVTGVGPGTGAAIVKRFSAGGFRIMALARSAALINRLAQELPDVHAVTCDVSDESQVRTVVTDVKRRFGAAEVLIHNAVGGGWGSFREIDPKMLKGNFEVNVMARQGRNPGDRKHVFDPRQGQLRRLRSDKGGAAYFGRVDRT